MREKNDNKYPIKSIGVATRALELIKENDGVRVTELANELNVAKSTAHRYLSSLQESEWVVKSNDRYQVGLKFLQFGIYSRDKLRYLELIKERVDDLADKTNERVQFVAPEYGKGVVVHSALGGQAVDVNIEVGERIPLHVISPGKAILAEWPQERVEDYIQTYGLVKYTPNTITSRTKLREELSQVRDQGYAENKEEHVRGIQSVGAAIVDGDATPIGGISVSRPAYQADEMSDDDDLPQRIVAAANNIELNLRYQD